MPTLPWTAGPTDAVATADPTTTTGTSIVMASRFRVRGYRHVVPFFVDAMRVFAQTRGADGVIGVTLQARPLHKEFWTLSQWRDQDALDAMVRSEPHRSVMVRQRSAMADSAFRFWSAPADVAPEWADAKRRVGEDG